MAVNDDIADDIIRRQVRYSKYENGLWKAIAALLAKVENDLLARIEKGTGRTVSSERTQTLLRSVQRILDGGKEEFFDKLKADGKELSGIEAAAAKQSLQDHVPVAVSWITPPKMLLAAVVTEKPFDGKLLRDWVDDWSFGLRRQVEQQINIGIVEGQGIEDIVRRLKGTRANNYTDGILEGSRRRARAIVRTYTAHVTSAAREELYKANADIIAKEQWVATLDHRTCPICGSLDNQTFDVGKGPRTPIHPQCRCVRVPVVRSAESLRKNGLIRQRVARGEDGMNGKVPADMSFPEWLKRQPESVQKEVLGAKRFELFKGGTKFDKFVNDENEIIPLSQLVSGGARARGAATAARATRTAAASPAKPNIAFRTTKLGIDDAPDPRTVVSYAKAPSATHKLALAEYKGDDFAAVNEVLRGRRASYEAVENRIRNLDSAVRNSSLKDATTLYRGISDETLAGIASDAIGTSFSVKTFQSTSLSKGRATRFAVDGKGRDNPVLLKINAQKGANAIDMDRYGKGYTSQEREVLLPRDATYTIRGISEETGLDQNGSVVTLRIVEVDLG